MSALTLTRIYKKCRASGECLLWTGGLNKGGYPFIYDPAIYANGPHKTGMVSGRVAVWKLARHGDKPAGTKLVMTCGNRTCLQHKHMEPMTYVEAQQFASANGAYSSLKRRVANAATARKGAKLDRIMASSIKARALAGENRNDLAAEAGVSRSTVDQIARGQRWSFLSAQNSSVFNMAPSGGASG